MKIQQASEAVQTVLRMTSAGAVPANDMDQLLGACRQLIANADNPVVSTKRKGNVSQTLLPFLVKKKARLSELQDAIKAEDFEPEVTHDVADASEPSSVLLRIADLELAPDGEDLYTSTVAIQWEDLTWTRDAVGNILDTREGCLEVNRSRARLRASVFLMVLVGRSPRQPLRLEGRSRRWC